MQIVTKILGSCGMSQRLGKLFVITIKNGQLLWHILGATYVINLFYLRKASVTILLVVMLMAQRLPDAAIVDSASTFVTSVGMHLDITVLYS